jgi:hypothetical protein
MTSTIHVCPQSIEDECIQQEIEKDYSASPQPAEIKLPLVKFKDATDYDNSMFLLQRNADQKILNRQLAATKAHEEAALKQQAEDIFKELRNKMVAHSDLNDAGHLHCYGTIGTSDFQIIKAKWIK